MRNRIEAEALQAFPHIPASLNLGNFLFFMG